MPDLAHPQPARDYRRDHDAAPDWRPLEQVARACRDHPALPDLDPDDFMYMGRIVHPTQRPIHLYKHVLTRRYLNLDPAGHAWAFTPTPASGALPYRPKRDLASVVAWVQGGVTPLPAPTTEPPSLGL